MTRVIGRYELRRRLGRGGAGEVWDAVLHGPAGFRRRVAVKLLRAARADDDRDGLIQEARWGALIHHPNVVPTLELGVEDGRWYLVMERVDGSTVRAMAGRGPLDPSLLLDVGRQAATGLQHIHELSDDQGVPLGLIHRDIKPTNLMVDRFGAVRILDLGIAKLAGTPGEPAGTPGYMAPEQRQGEGGPQADVFGLGATLATLALGSSPFGRGARALGQLDDVDEVVCDPAFARDLDRVLDGLGPVLKRAMRHAPEARYPTVKAFREALRPLYGQVTQAVSLAGRLGAPTRSAPDTPPRPLPTVPPLVGRERERTALLAKVLDPEVQRIVVRGPAGCGKSHLVLATLREHPHVWCDLREVVDAAGLLRALSDAGGQPVLAGRLPPGPVWILDGVERCAAAVSALLEALPAGPTVVVVTRRRLEAVAGVELALGRLRRDDAVAMLRSVGGPGTTAEVRALASAVDRLPLALQLVGARARREGYAAALAALDGEVLDPVAMGLDASAADLPDAVVKALIDLSVWVGPFDGDGALATLGADLSDGLSALEILVDRSLLLARRGRFRMLGPVRSWAQRRDPRRVRPAEVRHGRWLARLGRRMVEGEVGVRPAQVAPVQRDLLVAVARAAGRGDGTTRALAALAAALHLWATGLRQHALAIVEEAVPTAGSYRRHLLLQLGDRCMILGYLDAAQRWIEPLLASEDPEERRCGERVMGRILGKMARYDEGRRLLDETLARHHAAGDPNSAWVCASRGELERRAGDFQQAVSWYERALEEALRVSPIRAERIRYDLVVTLLLLERYRDALPQLEDSIVELERTGRQAMAFAARGNLAETLWVLGRPREALDYAQQVPVGGSTVDDLLRAVGEARRVVCQAALNEELPAQASLAALGERLAGVPDLACQVAMVRIERARERHDPGLAAAIRDGCDGSLKKASPATRAQMAYVDACTLPLDAARRCLDGLAFDAPFSHAWYTLARSIVASRGGHRARARGALLEAGMAIDALSLAEEAPLVQALNYARAQV